MSRLEKTLWIMIAIYTLLEVAGHHYSSLAILGAIIVVRIIIWRLKNND